MVYIASNTDMWDCVLCIKKETDALCNDSPTLYSHGTPFVTVTCVSALPVPLKTFYFLMFTELKHDVLDGENYM
jgi:hypothetical protein